MGCSIKHDACNSCIQFSGICTWSTGENAACHTPRLWPRNVRTATSDGSFQTCDVRVKHAMNYLYAGRLPSQPHWSILVSVGVAGKCA
jgi:hypothetical protein